jgi:hypothetical protein
MAEGSQKVRTRFQPTHDLRLRILRSACDILISVDVEELVRSLGTPLSPDEDHASLRSVTEASTSDNITAVRSSVYILLLCVWSARFDYRVLQACADAPSDPIILIQLFFACLYPVSTLTDKFTG